MWLAEHRYTMAWVLWLALFAVIEGMALVNSRKGDTLSEHVWAWFGIGSRYGGFIKHCVRCDGPFTAQCKTNPKGPMSHPYVWREDVVRLPTGWTRVRRLVLVTFLVWLLLHFTTAWV